MGRMHQYWWRIWWQMMILWWNNWPRLEVVMTFHWFSRRIKPYSLYIRCRFQHLTAVVQILSTQKKQYKIPNKKLTFFCVIVCGYIRGWIGSVRRSLIIHSLSHLFLFAGGRFSTISLRGVNTVSLFKGTEIMW